MRLMKRSINDREHSGFVVLYPEEPEDMWHLYNLIRPSDLLRAPAIRKVKDEAGTGATVSRTVKTTLTIRVKSLDFDPQSSELHVAGTIAEQNDFVVVGRHHTLDLEPHRQFTLIKDPMDGGDEVGWDSVALNVLKQATDVSKAATAWAVIMQEGLGNICVLTDYRTVVKQRVEMPVPRKKTGYGADAHDKGVDKFYDLLLTTLRRHLDVKEIMEQSRVPPLLLASPGFTAQSFHKYMMAYATRTADKPLQVYARDHCLVVHSSTGHVHTLAEVLKEPTVLTKLGDTKFAKAAQVVDKFMKSLREDDGRAWYGPREVEKAVEKGGVGRGGGVLLISDKLFRSNSVAERRRWVALVDQVQKVEGGEVFVLSSAHESGQRIEGLGGVGAILTFPMVDLDEEVGEDEDGGGNDGPVVNGQNQQREIEDIDI